MRAGAAIFDESTLQRERVGVRHEPERGPRGFALRYSGACDDLRYHVL